MLEKYRNRSLQSAPGATSHGVVQSWDSDRELGFIERDGDNLVCFFQLSDAYDGVGCGDRVVFHAMFAGKSRSGERFRAADVRPIQSG